MTSRKSKLNSTTLVIGLAALALSACQSNDATDYMSEVAARWQPIHAVPQNHVETVSFEHIIAFPSGSVEPTEAEKRRLHEFIAISNLTENDTIVVEAAPSASGNYNSMTASRLDGLAQELAQVGLPTFVAEASTASSLRGQDQVAVMVTRAIVVTPDCSIPERLAGEEPDYSMGCNNTAALGLMVANPSDLARGRPLGPADAEKASLAMQKYRTGKEEELETEETK